MGIPVKYRSTTEPAIASYNFVDVASGTGYVSYYLADTQSAYILPTQQLWSNSLEQSGAMSGSLTLELDANFDILLNLPRVVRGKLIANISLAASGGTADGFTYVIVKFRKWDGTTETEIADGTSTNVNVAGGTMDGDGLRCIEVTIPETTFKSGETIRVTMLVYAHRTAGAGGSWAMGHDPKNRVTGLIGARDNSNSLVHIPFKIDL